MELKPSEIYYSQDSINNVFNERSQHSYKLIGETLDDICEERCSVFKIPLIFVKSVRQKWITADNRRLWMFKHLERLGKIETINVRLTRYIPKQKMNSKNGGVSIKVRGSPGGSWYLKPDKLITSEPEAHKTNILKEQSVSVSNDLRHRRPTLAWSESHDSEDEIKSSSCMPLSETAIITRKERYVVTGQNMQIPYET
ncbi:hypothetical protein MAR_003243, partial [Mya arenaria]